MLILALDTTTRAGSIALLDGARVLHERRGDPTLTHGQRLPTDLMRACDAAGVRPADLDLLAVAAGPGSFTGLRIGIASIQGLAMAIDRRVVPVPALQAIAAAAPADTARLVAWMDAQRGEVFAQVFERSADDVPVPLVEAISVPPAAALAAHRDRLSGASFHGDGAVRYRDVIEETLGPSASVAGTVPPLAGAVGRIAAASAEHAVLPHAIVPIYVRRPDAELARDRRQGGG